jgi:hypothetical protein
MKAELNWLHARINEIRSEHQFATASMNAQELRAYIRRHWLSVYTQCEYVRKQFNQMVAAKHKEVVIS